jgi:protoporphyrinogen IX oxidase
MAVEHESAFEVEICEYLAAHGWLYAKLVLVVVLTVYHHYLAAWRKAFAEDRNKRPARFYRMMNEVPTLLLIGIVVLAVVKPF